MNLPEQLKQADLNSSEVKIYLYLLENGLSTPSQISRGTSIARTNCYHILSSLEERGLIEECLIRKRKAYRASDPDSLLRNLQRKKEAVEQILPDLRGMYTPHKNKPKVKFYDGKVGIKTVFDQSLQSDEIMIIGSLNLIEITLPGFFKEYLSEIRKRRIVFKNILTSDSSAIARATKEELKVLYEYTIVPKETADFPNHILFWEDTIALVNFQDPAFGTILKNKLLTTTFKTIFNLLSR